MSDSEKINEIKKLWCIFNNAYFLEVSEEFANMDGGQAYINDKMFKSLTIHRQTKEEKELEELKALADKLGYSVVPKYQGNPREETLFGDLAKLEREGWTLWNGGSDCPISNDYDVDLKLKSGENVRADWPSDWNWEEVIAYRVLEG